MTRNLPSGPKRRVPQVTYHADMKWWERLQGRMTELGWTKAELNRRSGVAYDSINKYLRGDVDNPRGEVLKDLAQAVGRDSKWLLFGEPMGSYQPEMKIQGDAAKLLSGMRPMPLSQAEGRTLSRHDDVAERSFLERMDLKELFALTVPDSSMETIFHAGDVILCGHFDVAPGDFVIAAVQHGDEQGNLFRQFRPRGILGKREEGFDLTPLNPVYPTIVVSDPARARVFARVVAHLRRV